MDGEHGVNLGGRAGDRTKHIERCEGTVELAVRGGEMLPTSLQTLSKLCSREEPNSFGTGE